MLSSHHQGLRQQAMTAAVEWLNCRQLLIAWLLLTAVIGLATPCRVGTVEVDGWKALLTPDTVGIMRHALAPGTGDPANINLDDCTTQRNLSDEGRSQARAIGQRLRAVGIEKAGVFSSAWCRCQETAQLLDIGEVQTLESLNSFFQFRQRAESQTRSLQDWLDELATAQPVLLVTHQVNITALTGIFPDSGEMIVIRKDDANNWGVIDRLSLH